MRAERDFDQPGSIVTGQRVPRRKRDAAVITRRHPTPAEARLWEGLRAGRLSGLHFRRGQNIGDYIADFYCFAARLVVEVDGSVHEGRREYDAARDTVLARRGLLTLRFTNHEVMRSLRTVLERIHDTAIDRIDRFGARFPA